MRILLVAVALLAIASTTSAQQKLKIARRSIDVFAQKVSDSLEWVRSILKKKKITLPTRRALNINDEGVALSGYVEAMSLTGTSNFFVKIESLHAEQSVDVVLKLPRIVHRGKFAVSGKYQGNAVKGAGRFEIALTNLRFHGLVKLATDDEVGIQLSDLEVSYSFKTIKVRADGLRMNGSCKKRNNYNLSKYIQTLLRKDSVHISKSIANAIKKVSNAMIKGKSLSQAVKIARANDEVTGAAK